MVCAVRNKFITFLEHNYTDKYYTISAGSLNTE